MAKSKRRSKSKRKSSKVAGTCRNYTDKRGVKRKVCWGKNSKIRSNTILSIGRKH